MKTNGPDSGQERPGYRSAQRRDQGLGPRSRQEQVSSGTSRVRHITKENGFSFNWEKCDILQEKKKKTLFFSIEAVETKLRALRVPFLWAARCRNVPRLAPERAVCAWRWRKPVHTPGRRRQEGESSIAGQSPPWIPGAPLISPTSSALNA